MLGFFPLHQINQKNWYWWHWKSLVKWSPTTELAGTESIDNKTAHAHGIVSELYLKSFSFNLLVEVSEQRWTKIGAVSSVPEMRLLVCVEFFTAGCQHNENSVTEEL